MTNRRALLAVVGATAVVIALAGAGLAAVWGVRRSADDAPRASLVQAQPVESPPPRELRDGEAYVRTEVLASGDVLVTHWIQSSALLFTVVLALPQGDSEGLAADEVSVVADGQAVVGPERVSTRPVRYPFLGSSTVQISYRLTGAVERSISMPGRALARWTALDVSYEVATPLVTRTVVAPQMLSLACSTPARSASVPPASRPCGTRVTASEWTIDLQEPFNRDLVVAAVNLRRGPADAQGLSDLP